MNIPEKFETSCITANEGIWLCQSLGSVGPINVSFCGVGLILDGPRGRHVVDVPQLIVDAGLLTREEYYEWKETQ